LLLHTTQLIKDHLFIAALLLIIFIMVNWLTKPKPTLFSITLMAIAGALGSYVIVRTRTPYWALLIVVFVFIGFVLLVVRQVSEKQLMWGYMFSAIPMILVLITIYRATPTASLEVIPHRFNPPTVARSNREPSEPVAQVTLKRRLDLLAVRIWQLRFDYERAEGGLGTIDNGVVFANAAQLVAYTPRATLIGFLAPFPNQWFAQGRQTGRMGRLVAAAEMLVVYVFCAFALVAVWRSRKRLEIWLLVLISLVGVTTLALIVPNLGALYRMRYGFLILLVPLAMSTLRALFDRKSQQISD
jgi:hypothetical protein